MECSFEEKVTLPNGGYRHTKCINKAKIWTVNDPCYGLCFTCAYRKLKVENERLKEYSRHLRGCNAEYSNEHPCTCGFEQALKEK